jgi:hypothetical protein
MTKYNTITGAAPTIYPVVDDPRVITLECHACERQWFVLIPEEHPKRFFEDLVCRCGADPRTSIFIKNGTDKFREIIHGARSWRHP